MKIIGLTGGSGCGKGVFAAILARRGIPSLDTDKVYHSLTDHDTPCVRELRQAFGDEIIAADGALSRKRLAEIVFFRDEKRAERQALLNRITHKYVKAECLQWLEKELLAGRRAVVLDVPLLFEAGLDEICDMTVAILAMRETRILRIMKRDGLSREAAEARIDAQPEDGYYITRADHCYYNDGTRSDLEAAAERILRCLT